LAHYVPNLVFKFYQGLASLFADGSIFDRQFSLVKKRTLRFSLRLKSILIFSLFFLLGKVITAKTISKINGSLKLPVCVLGEHYFGFLCYYYFGGAHITECISTQKKIKI